MLLGSEHKPRKSDSTGTAAVRVCVELSDSVTREHKREVLARELADNATEFFNVVIGTFDENRVFPEDIIKAENELLKAMHLTVAALTAADWIDFCFDRHPAMKGRHSTRLHLFAAKMAKHFREILRFKLNLCEKRCPSEFAIKMWCCALMVTHEMTSVFGNVCVRQCLKNCPVRKSVMRRHQHQYPTVHPFMGRT